MAIRCTIVIAAAFEFELLCSIFVYSTNYIRIVFEILSNRMWTNTVLSSEMPFYLVNEKCTIMWQHIIFTWITCRLYWTRERQAKTYMPWVSTFGMPQRGSTMYFLLNQWGQCKLEEGENSPPPNKSNTGNILMLATEQVEFSMMGAVPTCSLQTWFSTFFVYMEFNNIRYWTANFLCFFIVLFWTDHGLMHWFDCVWAQSNDS